MIRSFSLLEIIFTILLISIIAVVAIPKLFFTIDNANIIKLKAEIAIIRDKINSFNNKQLLLNTNTTLENLDTIIPTTWTKTSLNTFKCSINSKESIEFIYNKEESTFNCNLADNYCKELIQ